VKDVLLFLVVLTGLVAYCAAGARFAREIYTQMHHAWFDEKIAERRAALGKKAKNPETPEDTLRILRKKWGNDQGAQGEAMALAIFMFFAWPAFKPLFSLARDAEPSSEEQKLVIAAQEAEIDRLTRQQRENP
jgi:hypothetical protein